VTTRATAIGILALVIIAATSCDLVGAPTPTSTLCDGISSEIGGCGVQAEFTGSDCTEVGREFGRLVDESVLEIIAGPEDVGGNARSVRLKQVVNVLALRADDRLEELDLRADCDSEEFLGAAEVQFSEELRATVGGALYDGDPPATYEEWLADVADSVRVIDTED
jgi:hypothetical protein